MVHDLATQFHEITHKRKSCDHVSKLDYVVRLWLSELGVVRVHLY
jgi:hypothetical protein